MLSQYTSYFDAGGGKDHGFIVVSGWLSTFEKWKSFETKWKGYLRDFHVPYFHMKEFAQSKGPFSTWQGDEPKRRKFLSSAVDIVKSHVEYGVSCIVAFEGFEKMNRVYHLDTWLGSPYALAGLYCSMEVKTYVREKHPFFLPPIEYVFDDGDIGKGELIRVMQKEQCPVPIFKPSRDRSNNDGELQPGVVQLQSADFVAYELRKGFVDDPKGDRPATEFRKPMRALARIPTDWIKYTEKELTRMCEKAHKKGLLSLRERLGR